MRPAPTLDELRRAPKVLLHDHLDGGLRPATVIELARETGYRGLPTTDEAELTRWFTEGAARQDLVLYLETFDHTVGVMQTKDALQRVAQECAEDLAADGVVYAEVRFAPEQHLREGLTLDEVVEAVARGVPAGHRRHGPHDRHDRHRHAPRRPLHRDRRAGGAPPRRRRGRLRHRRQRGRATRPPATSTPSSSSRRRTSTSPSTPARRSGCRRSGRRCSSAAPSGSGTACASSTTSRSTTTGRATLGRLASFVRDRRVPLEMCPTSNVNTGVCDSIAEHPIGLLARLRFRVTVNTDNRLMSGVSLTSEMAALVDAFGYGWDEIEWLTLNAMKSSFWPFDQRLRIINQQIKPAYAQLRAVRAS